MPRVAVAVVSLMTLFWRWRPCSVVLAVVTLVWEMTLRDLDGVSGGLVLAVGDGGGGCGGGDPPLHDC